MYRERIYLPLIYLGVEKARGFSEFRKFGLIF
jgi:hypothetical protein